MDWNEIVNLYVQFDYAFNPVKKLYLYIGWQNQLKPICLLKLTHLNKIQTYPIINWVKWVLTQ